MTRSAFVNCTRCGRRVHRSLTVHSRHTGAYYCYSGVNADRCRDAVQRELDYLAEHFGDRDQGQLIA